MPSFKVDVDFEVYCSCGAGLCQQAEGDTDRNGKHKVTVEPCKKCLDAAEDKGYDRGLGEEREGA